VVEAGPEGAPAVVLLHGISRDGAHDWDELVPALARTHRVLTFDLPGFGRSTKEPAAFGPLAYADLVEELMESRVKGSFDLVAHSMGVSIALEVAKRSPDRLRRLVLADAAALLHGQALTLEQIRRGQARLGVLGRLLDPLHRGAYDMMGRLPEHLVHRFAISLSEEAAVQAAARLMVHDSGEALDAVRSPTLVIWGRRDDVVSQRGAWALVSRIRDARLAFIDEAAHMPMRETAAEFNGLVSRWLAGQDDVGRALAPAIVASERDGECSGVRNRFELSGAYRKIVIEGCRNVVLVGVRAQEIEISGSTVVAEDTVVTGGEVALVMWRSRLMLSGGAFSARVAMRLSNSELDLAGVTLRGKEAAIEAIGNAKVLCSLCRLERQDGVRRLHGFRVLRPAGTL
jgi:pimeloyl-ACP methyl ester carboxylesterase